MKPNFSVRVETFQVIREVEGSWTTDDYRALLEQMEFDGFEDIATADLKEMCLMSLQDLKPQEAAGMVLKYRLGDALHQGQIDNASHEMLDEKLWEEFADLALHEQMFYAGSLLFQVAPRVFPKPDAVSVQLTVTGMNGPAKEIIARAPHESWVVRLVADGMEAGAALHRMFDDQLAGPRFEIADKIIWTVKPTRPSEGTLQLALVSSDLWLGPLEQTEGFESSAEPDEVDSPDSP